jgi:hypothetical protein
MGIDEGRPPMKPRFTIAQAMIWTAVIAINTGLVRAFVVQEMFYGGILIFFALQVGLWRLLRNRGRARRFWLGFEVAGATAVVALFLCEGFPESALNRMLMWYTDFSLNLGFLHLPSTLADRLDEHWDLFLAVVYFVPEFALAVLGGSIAFVVVPSDQRP